MSTPGGELSAFLSFGTDLPEVGEIIDQAAGRIDGALSQMFQAVERLSTTTGMQGLSDQATGALARITELQAALVRLGTTTPVLSPEAIRTNSDPGVLQALGRSGQGVIPIPGGPTTRAGEALVPFQNGEIGRVDLQTGKLLQTFQSEAQAVAFVVDNLKRLATAYDVATGNSGAAVEALNAEAAAASRTAAEIRALEAAEKQRQLIAGIQSGDYRQVGPNVVTPEGTYALSTGRQLTEGQAFLAQQREEAKNARDIAKAQQEIAEANVSPFSRGLDEVAQASKYVLAYAAFFKLIEIMKDGVNQTREYQEGLLSLDIALQSVDREGAVAADTLSRVGASGGLSPGESLQVAARGVQAFRTESSASPQAAQTVAIDSVTAAMEAQVLTGGKLNDVQGQLIAGAREFNLGADGQTRVLDAATNAYRNFGGSIQTVLEGMSQVAGLGEEAGFSVEQTANLIGLITSSTNLSGSAAAGDLKRILGGAGSPAFQNALASVGVDVSGNTAQELTQLGQVYGTLNDQQKQQIETTLGGRRSAEALIPILQNITALQEANARSVENAGAAEAEYNKRQDTLAGTLRQVNAASDQLLVSLGQTGAADGFGLALRAITPLLDALNEFVDLFNQLPGFLRGGIGAIADVTIALAAMERVFQRSVLIGGGTILPGTQGRIAAKNAADNGAPIEEAGRTTAASITTAGEEVAAALRGVATEVTAGGEEIATAETTVAAETEAGGVARSGGALASLAGGFARIVPTVGLILGSLAAINEIDKTVKLSSAESKGQGLLNYGGGNADDLQNQASKIAAAEQDIKHASSGFTGAIADFLSGHQADAAISRLKTFRTELQREATELSQITAQGNGLAVFGSKGPQTAQDITDAVKQLQGQGYTGAGIAAVLAQEIGQLTGVSAQRQLVNAPAGSVALGGQTGAQFVDGLFGSIIPTKATDIGRLQDALNRINAGAAAGGAKPVSLADALGNADFAGQFQVGLSGKQRAVIHDQLTEAIGGKEVLDPQDLATVANIIANGYGLGDDASRKRLAQQVLLALRQLSGSQVAGKGRQDLLASNPELLGTFATALAQQGQQALSDASARGADSAEVTKISQTNLSQLRALASDAAKAGINNQVTQQQLPQLIAVARKTAYDNFVNRVNEILAIASAGKDQAQSRALQAEATSLISRANSIDASRLPSNFGTLAQAEGAVTQAALDQGKAISVAAEAAFRAAEADAALLLQDATALDQVAQTALGREDVRGEAIAATATANAAAARAKAKTIQDAATAARAAAAKATLNDPAQQPKNDAQQNALQSTDTAEQIAAARYAASIFPTSKLEQARAAVLSAKADLDAQTKGTVAYYNALAQLHQAEYQFSTTVLDNASVARQLHEDNTDPLVRAREELLKAQQALGNDRKRGAPADVLQQDELNVRLAQQQLASTAFEQNLNQVKTNYELQRISEAQYIAYLNKQHDVLSRVANRSYQQTQELNEVDQLLQEASKQMQGQWNLGNIKLPTIYEVRRSLQNQADARSVQNNYDHSTTNIEINGADFAKVMALVNSKLGSTAQGRVTVSARRT
jgi:hypothetical protein